MNDLHHLDSCLDWAGLLSQSAQRIGLIPNPYNASFIEEIVDVIEYHQAYAGYWDQSDTGECPYGVLC